MPLFIIIIFFLQMLQFLNEPKDSAHFKKR